LKFPRYKTTPLPLVSRNWLIELGSYSVALFLSMVLFVTFVWAYLFNDMVFVARINDYGEAHWEMVLLCGLISFLFYGFFVRCKELKKRCI